MKGIMYRLQTVKTSNHEQWYQNNDSIIHYMPSEARKNFFMPLPLVKMLNPPLIKAKMKLIPGSSGAKWQNPNPKQWYYPKSQVV